MSDKDYSDQRSHVRFKAEINTLAHIGFQDNVDDFNPELVGLAFSEAYNGCGVVLLHHMAVAQGELCVVKCGDIGPIMAKIRWVQKLDEDAIKIGLEYNP